MEMNDKYKFLAFLGSRINENNEKIRELLEDENVRKYIYLVDENRRLSLGVKDEMELRRGKRMTEREKALKGEQIQPVIRQI